MSAQYKLNETSILVHAAFNTVGQAAIAIFLSQGGTVYATVENEEQSRSLRKRFPSVSFPRTCIIVNKINRINVPVCVIVESYPNQEFSVIKTPITK